MDAFQLSFLPNQQSPPTSCSSSQCIPQNHPAERESTKSFAKSIRAFVCSAESNPPTEYSISRLVTDFRFQKRRLYDVMSVLCAVGCCRKVSADSVQWMGMCRVSRTLLQLQRDARADCEIPLDSIIPSHATVCISALTVSFLLCFLALHIRTLRIKQVSRYLSRKSRRHKSTLCKLYQIAHILEASGIVVPSDAPGDVSIVDRYWAPLELNIPDEGPKPLSPFRIQAVLNRYRPAEERILLQRRMEFTMGGPRLEVL
jgi:hypothetical protein